MAASSTMLLIAVTMTKRITWRWSYRRRHIEVGVLQQAY